MTPGAWDLVAIFAPVVALVAAVLLCSRWAFQARLAKEEALNAWASAQHCMLTAQRAAERCELALATYKAMTKERANDD